MTELSSDVINALRCSLNTSDHFLENAYILPCGHNACMRCIKSMKGRQFECQFQDCKKKQTVKDIGKLTANPTVPILLKMHSKQLYEFVKRDCDKLSNQLENVNFEEVIETNVSLIELDIDVKIESLKAELDNIGENMRLRLKAYREQMFQ
jgi:hypothetical protein